ncbi:MAG: low temperature requirement protein A [Armatimonadetes bacterium]|nr:low temperature requirement protein A [Armatimonadota bacterium]
MRLRKGLVLAATLRTAPGVFEERHATWLELFYDLAFVAAISQLSSSTAHHMDWHGIGKFMVLFIPIWWAWVGQAFYLSRFDSDDLVHRLMAFLQILIVAAIAINIPAAYEGNPRAFTFCYAAIRLTLIAEYLIAGWQIKRARKLTTTYAIGFGVAAAIWAVSTFLPAAWILPAWGLAIVIDFAAPFVRAQTSIDIPPDYSHIPERFGLFTIIVLGEAILAAVSGMRPERFSANAWVIGPLGLLLSFGLWWIYFDGVKGHQVSIPRRTRDIKRLMVWLFSHMPLAAGIVLSAAGIREAMLLDSAGGSSGTVNLILVVGFAMTLLSMHAVYWSGLNPKLAKMSRRIGWPHAATTGMVIPVGAVAPSWPATSIVGSLCTLAVLHVFWTFRDLPELDEILNRVESARHQTASNV